MSGPRTNEPDPVPEPDPEVIFGLLREWGLEHARGVASTEDFVSFAGERGWSWGVQSFAEWFFSQWLDREDRPHYDIGWSAGEEAGGWIVFFEGN